MRFLRFLFRANLVLTLLISWAEGYIPVYTAKEESTFKDDAQNADFHEFKKAVKSLATVPFMHHELWLAKVFRRNEFNVDKAKAAFMDTLKFREQHKLDELLTDDSPLAEFKNSSIYSFEMDINVDKEGRPIALGFGGKWQVFELSSKPNGLENLRRFGWNMWDIMTSKAFAKRKKENVSRFMFIADLGSFDPRNACGECIDYWTDTFQLGDKHWPDTLSYCFFVNTPTLMVPVVDSIRNLVAPESQRNLFVFDTDSTKWMKVLRQYVDEEEIPMKLWKSKKGASLPGSSILPFGMMRMR